MKIMSHITWASMKANKLRTIVTIIGIILSATMFTAVTTFCSSILGFLNENYIYTDGNYHVGIYQADEALLSDLQADKRFGLSCTSEVLGYGQIPSHNEDKPYLYVEGVDDSFIKQMSLHLTQGRFAENDTEIVLPLHVVTNGKWDVRIGDSITLELGRRMVGSKELFQNSNFNFLEEEGEEEIAVSSKKTYTVVGFVERPGFEERTAPGYTSFTVKSQQNESIGSNFYSLIKNTKKNYMPIAGEYPVSGTNTFLLMSSGYMGFGNWNNFLYGFASIFVVLILIGSVSLIYSAFSISVSERTKQFGLLSSIGATRKQMRMSVLYEALIYSVIGIPIGLVAGCVGIGVTLFLCRDLFESLWTTGGAVVMRLHVSVAAIVVATVIALITVLISAWIPSRRAMKITPLEAIRQSRDIKTSNRQVRYSKLSVKLFGAPGMLAKKYYSRSRKKYRATIIALAMSVMLFISASSFCMYLTNSVNMSAGTTNVDIRVEMSYDDYQSIRNQFKDISGVTEVSAGIARSEVFCAIGNSALTDEVKLHFTSRYADVLLSSDAFIPESAAMFGVPEYYIDDGEFRAILAANGLNEADFFGEEAKLLIMNSCEITEYESVEGEMDRHTYRYSCINENAKELYIIPEAVVPDGYRYYSTALNDEGILTDYFTPTDDEEVSYDEKGRPIGLPTQPAEYYKAQIGGIIEETPFGMQPIQVMRIIKPFSALDNYEDETIMVGIKCDDPYACADDIKLMITENGIIYTDSMIHNFAESERAARNLTTLIEVFSYGFIVLISLISVANVFNTISTNVALRRRDYAMLRSMGMGDKDMRRMTNHECLSYGSRAVIFGLPLATIFSFFIYLINAEVSDMKFTLPWTAVGIAILSVFAVVFLSMLYSTSKLDKDNPVEVLKDENI